MSSVKVVNAEGNATRRSVELPDDIFAAKVNVPLIHQVVTAQQAAARQGTHAVKGRGQVRGGGKKPYRQKGTGRARQGSIRAPQFTGGGVVHGPQPRSYAQRTPKKMKAAALRGALSDRAQHGRVHVIAEFLGESVQTKLTQTAKAALRKITERKNVLVIVDRDDERTWLGLRNLQGVHLLAADQVNTLDVMLSDDVVFTEKGYEAFLAHVAGAPQTSGEEDK